VLPKDVQGNAHTGDVLFTDCRNTLVHATSRLVGLVGVQDLIVVETPDAVLVADKTRSQDVKHIVNQLGQQKREEHTLHRKVHRPWGWYDSIDEGGRFKVKRIQVNPKASLSLQKHHHRAEHWIVVTGTAEITNGDKVLTLTETNRLTFRWVRCIASLIQELFLWKSSKCNLEATWAKTISCALKIPTAEQVHEHTTQNLCCRPSRHGWIRHCAHASSAGAN